MIGDGDEGAPDVLGHELLGQWLTGIGVGIIHEDERWSLRAHRVESVDERGTDDVLMGRHDGRRGDVSPDLRTSSLVEFVHQIGQGLVTRLTGQVGDGRGVLHLHERDDVGVQTVDGRDDLGLLVVERLSGVGTAHRAEIGGDRRAGAIRVGLAAVLVLAQVGEVVEHVEAGELEIGVETRGLGRTIVGGGDRTVGRLGARDHASGLEVPPEPVVHDHRSGEAHVGAGTHRCVLGQVRQRGVLGLVVGLVVPARTVVQIDGSGTVLVLDLLGILTGTGHLGTLVQRLGAEGEANGAELVELVIVGDGVGALWLHEHGLIRLTLRIGARQGCEFHRLDVGTALGLGDARPIDLGETVELRDLTGDDDALTCGVGTGGLGGVDEDAVGGIGRGLGHTTRAGSLDVEAIEPALGVDGGDDARGGHDLADHRAGVGGALDVGDARLAGRGLGSSGGC